MNEWMAYIILLFAGAGAGTLNVIAGGGSFLTLPVLIFLGLPPTVANGTNRIGILLESLTAVYGFSKSGVMDWRAAIWAGLPASLGALIGSFIATNIDDQSFQKTLAILMLVITLVTLWSPIKKSSLKLTPPPKSIFICLAFFLVGIYGGFVQAGVGFFLLAATTWCGLNLVRGNAVKVLTVFIFTAISLAMFAWEGKVDWFTGSILAIGFSIGGWLGTHLTLSRGHNWVKRVVTFSIVAFAVKLWFS